MKTNVRRTRDGTNKTDKTVISPGNFRRPLTRRWAGWLSSRRPGSTSPRAVRSKSVESCAAESRENDVVCRLSSDDVTVVPVVVKSTKSVGPKPRERTRKKTRRGKPGPGVINKCSCAHRTIMYIPVYCLLERDAPRYDNTSASPTSEMYYLSVFHAVSPRRALFRRRRQFYPPSSRAQPTRASIPRRRDARRVDRRRYYPFRFRAVFFTDVRTRV